MAKQYRSILESLVNKFVIDSHVRNVAGETVKVHLTDLLTKHNITDIRDEDIAELAFDLVDELAMAEYSETSN